MSEVYADEILLGRTNSSPRSLYDSLAKSHSAFQWQLPVTVKGLRIQLRSKSPNNAYGHSGRRKPLLDAHKLLASLAARGLLGVLPFVPLRIHSILIAHQARLELTHFFLQPATSLATRTFALLMFILMRPQKFAFSPSQQRFAFHMVLIKPAA